LTTDSTECAAASGSAEVEYFAESKDPFIAEYTVKVCSKGYPVPKHTSAGITMNGCPFPVSFGLGASTMQSGEWLHMVWTIILLFLPVRLYCCIRYRLPLLRLHPYLPAIEFTGGDNICGQVSSHDGLPGLDESCTSNVECLNKLLRRIASSVLHVRPQNFPLA
jgi:hypothetical protein